MNEMNKDELKQDQAEVEEAQRDLIELSPDLEYLYICPPNDWWGSFRTIENYLFEIESVCETRQQFYECVKDFCLFLIRATAEIGRISAYEYRLSKLRPSEEVHISGLPSEPGGYPELVIVFKEDNNGTCLILSSVELSYLNEGAFEIYKNGKKIKS